MSKVPFPSIANEIRSVPTPKPRVDISLRRREVPEAAMTDGVRNIAERWGSVSQLAQSDPSASELPVAAISEPEPEPVPDREKWPSVRFECPPYLDRELSLRGAGEGVTKTYLVLKALREAGFTVRDEDLNKDKRKYRK